MTAPVSVLALSFGSFPQVDRLNRRFVPGHQKLKLTLEIDLRAVAAGIEPGRLGEALAASVPTLGEHSCRGDDRAGGALAGGVDRAAGFAHLLEHVIIDLLHYTARMRTCSGITCGHRDPPSRFDLFVEAPDRALARLCVATGVEMVEEGLRGVPPAAVYRRVALLARYLHANPRSRITEPAAAGIIEAGNAAAVESLRVLGEAGFIHEIDMCVNFSGTPSWMKTIEADLEASPS